MAALTIQDEALTQLGPCALVVDDANNVRWVSVRLAKLLGVSIEGQNFDRLAVRCDRPHATLGLRRRDGVTLPLRGGWLRSDTDDSRAFVGAPSPATTEEMSQLGITIDDFPQDNAWINYLIQADECTVTQNDARERIGQLKQERAKLSEARDRMRDARRAALNLLSDVDEARQRADEARGQLEEAHARVGQLFEAISSVLIGVDAEGRVTAWNGTAEGTFGIDGENAVGQLLDNLKMEWDYAVIVRGMAACHAENRPVRIDEMRFKRPDGTEGFLGVTLNLVSADAGRDGGVLLVAADITEQKILQSQLTQAQKLESIGQLAAGIAHEINTPTQYVGDNTRFLQDSVPDLIKIVDCYAGLLDRDQTPQGWDERVTEIRAVLDELDIEFLKDEIPKAIEQSLEGLDRVARIVRSMKEFSHPAGKEKQPADLNTAIESTITVARNEWKYVAEMVTDFDSSLPPVPCLVGEFNQVILNMIINAAHAITDVVGKESGDKGTITVSTRHDGNWAEIRISDTGTGIPEEIRSKIFDPFFTTKEVGKGTGQGLAIARTTVVKKHDGELGVESEVGRGTTFVIRLPIDPRSMGTMETPKREAANSLC